MARVAPTLSHVLAHQCIDRPPELRRANEGSPPREELFGGGFGSVGIFGFGGGFGSVGCGSGVRITLPAGLA